MFGTHSLCAAVAGTSDRARRIVAGVFALAAMLLPLGAWGMNSTSRHALEWAGNPLPLPPIPYLGSMRWMSWRPDAPVFQTDILLLPDNVHPGQIQLPSEHERSLPRVS